jgi:hypothetical protein
MPLLPGKANRAQNFKEFHAGPTYARTKKKFGTADANRQAVAVVLSNERRTVGSIHSEMRKKKK